MTYLNIPLTLIICKKWICETSRHKYMLIVFFENLNLIMKKSNNTWIPYFNTINTKRLKY